MDAKIKEIVEEIDASVRLGPDGDLLDQIKHHWPALRAALERSAAAPSSPGIAAAPDGTAPCGYCRNENLCVEIHTEAYPGMTGFAVRCGSAYCGARGPVRVGQMDAVREWNKIHDWYRPAPLFPAPERADEPSIAAQYREWSKPAESAGEYRRETTEEERAAFRETITESLPDERDGLDQILSDLTRCEQVLAAEREARERAEQVISEIKSALQPHVGMSPDGQGERVVAVLRRVLDKLAAAESALARSREAMQRIQEAGALLGGLDSHDHHSREHKTWTCASSMTPPPAHYADLPRCRRCEAKERYSAELDRARAALDTESKDNDKE